MGGGETLPSKVTLPLLGEIVSEVIEDLDDLRAAEKNQKGYLELAVELETAVRSLNSYLPNVAVKGTSECAKYIIQAIQDQLGYIKQQRDRVQLGRLARAMEDADELMACRRRIGALFTQLHNSRLKGMRPAKEARYDSAQSKDVKRRACTENTRINVVADAWTWIQQPSGAKIYWMNGMAGTGKTTIAYTVSAQLEERMQLGASFFCTRTLPECRDVRRIIPTIAYQLARFSYPFQSQLCQMLGSDPDVSTRDPTTQFRKLVKQPLMGVKDTLPSCLVVVIDALDELDDSSGTRNLLKVLFENAVDLPIKFFVTSRPDYGIYDTIMLRDSHARDVLHLHEIEESFVKADIETYLKAELGPLSLSEVQIQQLANQSGRFFIYAATAVEYIEPSDPEADHVTRLAALLRMTANRVDYRQQVVDELYTVILRAIFEKPNRDPAEAELIKLVLWSTICAQEPLTITSLSKLLRLDNEQRVYLALKPLRSVLHVSEGTKHITTLHISFPDFMFNGERSGEFACSRSTHHGTLAQRCFELMGDLLHFNMGNLESSLIPDTEVPDLPSIIDVAIKPELFYACQYWGAHLQLSKPTTPLTKHFEDFITCRLLAWLEVLTLKQVVNIGASVLGTAETWLQDNAVSSNILQLTHDSWRFVTSFAASPASLSTPHIYISALALWHPASPIYKAYGELIQNAMAINGTTISYGDMALLATWSTASSVDSMALSSDGTRLVSGSSSSGGMRLWDVRTGTKFNGAGRLKVHSFAGPVQALTFSPDGAHIASACEVNYIEIWDSTIGKMIARPAKLPTHEINSVAFSPDGTSLVFGTRDGAILAWQLATSNISLGPIYGHTGSINSVTVSADGSHIISGSYDRTVRIWDMRSGAATGEPLRGHSASVLCVACSPCGTLIVSGSDDHTIYTWQMLPNNLVAHSLVFEGHTGSVRSVAISPNVKFIASGSSDRTIRVWDVLTGTTVAGPFIGHTLGVNVVLFSHDGTRIFSGSKDNSIRVWDSSISTQSASSTFPISPGYSSPIMALGVSPDSQRIVSYSMDQTISIWDRVAKKAVSEPLILQEDQADPTGNVAVYALSPDGSRIAFSSRNCNIFIWDILAGRSLGGPFEGHTDQIRSITFSPDGTQIVSCSKDHTVMVWEVHHAGPLRTLRGHTSWVNSAIFSPDGTHVISGSEDSTVRVWLLAQASNPGPSSRKLSRHISPVVALDISPDGSAVASGSFDSMIHVWSISTAAKIGRPLVGRFGSVRCVKFSPNGAYLASGYHNCTIWVWDISTSGVVAMFEGHTGRINAITFTPNGTQVVSGSEDCSIRVWDVQTVTRGESNSRPPLPTQLQARGSWQLDEDGWI
ncbi:hypothetical protein FRC11_003704, partial [Ceratobasidium sp. 423]